jgi:DNA-binding transcriptional MerR regulator
MNSGVFDTKKHTNVKRKPEYRRIRKYYKGLDKFKSEKARRKQVLELQNQGLTIKQIAEHLNVSERTVKRDLAKVMIYVKKKRTQLMLQEREAVIRQMDDMSPKRQLEFILELQERHRRIFKVRKCNSLLVTIDVDAALDGRYAVSFNPRLPVDILENGRITLELAACGRKQAIARIYVGKVVWGSANLQTNQSMNSFVKPVLKGLKVVDSTTPLSSSG